MNSSMGYPNHGAGATGSVSRAMEPGDPSCERRRAPVLRAPARPLLRVGNAVRDRGFSVRVYDAHTARELRQVEFADGIRFLSAKPGAEFVVEATWSLPARSSYVPSEFPNSAELYVDGVLLIRKFLRRQQNTERETRKCIFEFYRAADGQYHYLKFISRPDMESACEAIQSLSALFTGTEDLDAEHDVTHCGVLVVRFRTCDIIGPCDAPRPVHAPVREPVNRNRALMNEPSAAVVPGSAARVRRGSLHQLAEHRISRLETRVEMRYHSEFMFNSLVPEEAFENNPVFAASSRTLADYVEERLQEEGGDSSSLSNVVESDLQTENNEGSTNLVADNVERARDPEGHSVRSSDTPAATLSSHPTGLSVYSSEPDGATASPLDAPNRVRDETRRSEMESVARSVPSSRAEEEYLPPVEDLDSTACEQPRTVASGPVAEPQDSKVEHPIQQHPFVSDTNQTDVLPERANVVLENDRGLVPALDEDASRRARAEPASGLQASSVSPREVPGREGDSGARQDMDVRQSGPMSTGFYPQGSETVGLFPDDDDELMKEVQEDAALRAHGAGATARSDIDLIEPEKSIPKSLEADVSVVAAVSVAAVAAAAPDPTRPTAEDVRGAVDREGSPQSNDGGTRNDHIDHQGRFVEPTRCNQQ
ncbi:hypothetical protein FVE85_7483 [Porphyridium purpureum]|uniref:Uncharacterized protein n=1 Tax=Porphyridium purpureum TaxID=35688 RepID=A0A5J4Z9S9_PORPP|nr:hypothetical protein FVE85_7483 [Porphyridium purpureum]|eukprot:POR8632..scf295_1